MIIINFKTSIMHGTPINICVQRGHGRTTWDLDNLRNCLSYSLVTVKGPGVKIVDSFLTFELGFCQSSL